MKRTARWSTPRMTGCMMIASCCHALMTMTSLNMAAANGPPPGCHPHWDAALGQPGFDGGVLVLTAADSPDYGGSILYAGGMFTSAGGANAHYIAQWLGPSIGWTHIGGGMNDAVRNILLFDFEATPGGPPASARESPPESKEAGAAAETIPSLYASGMFTMAGSVQANRVARWDFQAEQWFPLGDGIDGPVRVLTVFDDASVTGDGPALYAGGLFTTAGEVAANNIARWDGNDWSALGEGVNGMVGALEVFDDGSGPALYVGGSFTLAGGAPAHSIAKWDGENWSPLGSGMNNIVRALTVFEAPGGANGPALYAGGRFTMAGDVPAAHIARWDGDAWAPVSGGTNEWIAVLDVFDDGGGPALYAGGLFTTAGSVQADSIAMWTGEATGWSALGGGADASVIDLAGGTDGSGNPVLFVGGWFENMGGEPAGGIATWTAPQPLAPGDLNCNGTVGATDLLILLDQWGPCSDPSDCPADLTGDGHVGVPDLLKLLANWG